jgi:hypothetical protein
MTSDAERVEFGGSIAVALTYFDFLTPFWHVSIT